MSELKACALCGCEAEEIRIHSAAEKEVACTNKLCPLFQLMGISIELWQAPRPAENKIKAEGYYDAVIEAGCSESTARSCANVYANKLEGEE